MNRILLLTIVVSTIPVIIWRVLVMAQKEAQEITDRKGRKTKNPMDKLKGGIR